MFNSFPQPKPDGISSPWVHDWSAYQTVYDLSGTTVSIPANTWQTFVDVTGKGFLKWVRAFTGGTSPFNPAIRITVDGVPYQFQQQASGSYNQGNEINHEIPFKQSLKVEVQNSTASALTSGCDYLYLLQQAIPNPNKSTLLLQSQRNMAYASAANTTLTDVLNIAGSGYLLGVKFLGFYGTAGFAIYGDIAVDGAQKMTDRAVLSLNSENYKQSDYVGPIRFNTSLRIRTHIGSAGVSYVCQVWYSLD